MNEGTIGQTEKKKKWWDHRTITWWLTIVLKCWMQ